MVNDLVYTDVALHSCGYIEAADNVVRVAGDEAARGPFVRVHRAVRAFLTPFFKTFGVRKRIGFDMF